MIVEKTLSLYNMYENAFYKICLIIEGNLVQMKLAPSYIH